MYVKFHNDQNFIFDHLCRMIPKMDFLKFESFMNRDSDSLKNGSQMNFIYICLHIYITEWRGKMKINPIMFPS